MKVLVCGSRDWKNADVVWSRLRKLPQDSTIIHGCARGADRIASAVARDFNFNEWRFPARWALDGKRAGYLRNVAMLDEKPDLVIAFWDGQSPGTKHTIDEARRRGISVEVVSE